MNVKEKDELYNNIAKEIIELSKTFVWDEAVNWALFHNIIKLSKSEKLDFANYVEFTYGSSIETAVELNLGGKSAEFVRASHEILKACKEIKERAASEAKKENEGNLTNREKKYSKKLDLAMKEANELYNKITAYDLSR